MPTSLKERLRSNTSTRDRYDLRNSHEPEPQQPSSSRPLRSNHSRSDDGEDADDPDPPSPPSRPLSPLLSDGNADLQLLYKPQVTELVGLSFVSLWEMIRRNEFPAPLIIGNRSAWTRGEIQAWLASRPRREYLPPPDEEKRENAMAVRRLARKAKRARARS